MSTSKKTSPPAPDAPKPSDARVLYFWLAQTCTFVCILIGAFLAISGSELQFLFMFTTVLASFVVLAVQGPLAALLCSLRPVVPKARAIAAFYGLAALVTGVPAAQRSMQKQRDAKHDTLIAAAEAERWDDFEDALEPWPLLVPADILGALGNGCVLGRLPPLKLFARVASGAGADPALMTVAAATCGAAYTRWALEHDGSVLPKHKVAPPPIAFARDDQVLALLRAAGATFDQRDPRFPSDPPPLFYAYDAASLDRLIAAGADVHALDASGNTALHYAQWFDCDIWCMHWEQFDLALIEHLIELGLSPNRANKAGLTPLHTRLTQSAPVELIRALLVSGADVHAKDNQGTTALSYVRQYMQDDKAAQLRADKLLPEVDKGADP